MHAIMDDWQINMLAEVFQQEKFQITTSNTSTVILRQAHWEAVATQTPQGAFFPNDTFLENIEEYKYNKFIDIGNS